jgi:hypothetical protein
MGGLRNGSESDLMFYLENLVPVNEELSKLSVQVRILDGAAIINMLRLGSAKTFQAYATGVFLPYAKSSAS